MIRHLPLMLLGGLGTVLVGVIVFELLPGGDTATQVAAVAPSDHPADQPPPDDQAGDADSGDKVDVLLSRPLFNPTRAGTKAPTPSADTPTVASSDMPRLAGILISGDDKHAIFQNGADDKPVIVGEGEDIGGWTVQTIAASTVTVDGPNGTQTLEPKFDPNAVPSEPALPPAQTQAQAQPPQPRENQIAPRPGAVLPGKAIDPRRGRRLPPEMVPPNAAVPPGTPPVPNIHQPHPGGTP